MNFVQNQQDLRMFTDFDLPRIRFNLEISMASDQSGQGYVNLICQQGYNGRKVEYSLP